MTERERERVRGFAATLAALRGPDPEEADAGEAGWSVYRQVGDGAWELLYEGTEGEATTYTTGWFGDLADTYPRADRLCLCRPGATPSRNCGNGVEMVLGRGRR
jgi:hypothetical protein